MTENRWSTMTEQATIYNDSACLKLTVMVYNDRKRWSTMTEQATIYNDSA